MHVVDYRFNMYEIKLKHEISLLKNLNAISTQYKKHYIKHPGLTVLGSYWAKRIEQCFCDFRRFHNSQKFF